MKHFKLIFLIVLASIALTIQKQPAEQSITETKVSSPVEVAKETLVVNGKDSEQLKVGMSGPQIVVNHHTPRPVDFTSVDFHALDIGCGSEGDVCAVGTDYKVYCYDLSSDKWVFIPLNDEITSVTKVDVDDDGKIYIIAECGIYYLDCHDKWIKLPGTGKDIGVGVNFDVWKIGGQGIGEKYGVWKLFCECNCDCNCERICLRFRKHHYNICEPIIKRRCYWWRADIYGVAIDVFPNGDAAVVKIDGTVSIVDSKNFTETSIGKPNRLESAVDVTVSNDGVVFITTQFGNIYKYNFIKSQWEKVTIEYAGKRICSGPYSLIWYTRLFNNDVITSALYDYLP